MVRFDVGPLLQVQTRIAKLKSAYNSLMIGPRGLQAGLKHNGIMFSQNCNSRSSGAENIYFAT